MNKLSGWLDGETRFCYDDKETILTGDIKIKTKNNSYYEGRIVSLSLREFVIKPQNEKIVTIKFTEIDEFEIIKINTKEEFIKQLVEGKYRKNTVIVTNEDKYIIKGGDCFTGGNKRKLVCKVLGKVFYKDIKSIGDALWDYLVNELNESIIDIYAIG